MAAADQIKALIQSYGNGEDTRFFTIAMQIAAAEARKGNTNFAEELKKIIDKAKIVKQSAVGLIKTMPLNAAQKELDDLFELVHSKAKLADMVLDDMVRESLQRVLDEQANYEVLYENNLFPRRKLLLVGPPGCGKTLTAKALAAELGLPLFIIRLDGLISRYMGESISKLRLIFDAMKQYRAVYLFDEFDSIGTTRTISGDVGEIKRVLNFFLLQIEKDDSKSLIVAATNLPESLDTALFRRFDDIIRYPLPNKKEIVEFYKMALHRSPLAKGFSYNKLADMSIGLSYSEMGKICMDIEKKGLIYGSKALTIEGLKTYIEQRKKPF
ncbi:ATPase family associated with various cellular activities (AAA) [Chitinophaga ginsengisegetis]|uniref:ATPase family associated with various cellular activities (AAA) n=1 Tax=Chitinophaga ginsengisegetis TaxID=393003 RepID=A0A1T5P9M7_9BACT|nr:ATP-binding protein [Chitinophaga ginsengisegetis]SKD09421.1 ATPase family associated with various cellular activities (AAA) [Chitinophaga ginsengisegetis]